MTARVITESYAHGQLAVAGPTVLGVAYVSVEAWEGGAEASTLLYLTPGESADLAVAAIENLAELVTGSDPWPAVAALAAILSGAQQAVAGLATALAERATQNPRPLAPPVAEGRATAAGPSNPTAEPGRPTCDDCDPFLCVCGTPEALGPDDITDPDEPIGDLGGNYHESAVQAALGRAKAELLANSTLIGPAGGEDR